KQKIKKIRSDKIIERSICSRNSRCSRRYQQKNRQMTLSLPPIEIEYRGFRITREPTYNLISILPAAGNTLPAPLLSKYTEIRIEKKAVDNFMKETSATTKNN